MARSGGVPSVSWASCSAARPGCSGRNSASRLRAVAMTRAGAPAHRPGPRRRAHNGRLRALNTICQVSAGADVGVVRRPSAGDPWRQRQLRAGRRARQRGRELAHARVRALQLDAAPLPGHRACPAA
jgi:hypothetical protein